MMQRTCVNSWCRQSFEITQNDLDFYALISPVFSGKKEPIPSPTLCPDCRQQRRLSYRNERKFYHRKCDLTGKEVISIYSGDKPCRVFDQTAWWSDKWDQLATGRKIDPARAFFVQFHELSLSAPRPCIMNMGSENSLYTHHSPYNKNCYMCINTGYCEDCHYLTNFSVHNKDCVDCLAIQKCERCVECVDTKQAAFSIFLQECINCAHCSFCYDCQGCQNCFGCWNLRHKQYCIANEQLTREQYEERMQRFWPKTWEELRRREREFREDIAKRAIHKYLNIDQCENVTGDHISRCKDVRDSYYMFECQDCAYCYDCGDLKNAMDVLEPYHGELQYETHGCNIGHSLCVCSKCYECSNVLYSEYCFSCADCFGCFGLRRKKHCILNKQYTKEEYEQLVPKIIEHMRKPPYHSPNGSGTGRAGEWGEFFPIELSPFAYNETVAQEYFPLTKEEVLKRGWKWRDEADEVPKVSKVIPAEKLPDSIEEVPDDIINWAIRCEATKRPFKIIKQELDFYRQMKLPVPHLHPDERHRRRMALRNPRILWNRTCAKCRKPTATSYSPERPEIVYCEKCYLKEVY